MGCKHEGENNHVEMIITKNGLIAVVIRLKNHADRSYDPSR